MNVSLKRYFVQAWWEDRVRLGAQLVNPSDEDFARGGNGDGNTWFRTVSIQSLYRDFHERWLPGQPKVQMLEGPITCSGFMMILRGMLPPDVETLYVRTEKGRARCIRFRERDHYRTKIAA